MKMGMILVLMAMMVFPACGDQVKETFGPFNATFDMNTTAGYSISTEGPSLGNTSSGLQYVRCGLLVDSNESFVYLVLTRYDINNGKDIDINKTNINIIAGTLRAAQCSKAKLYQPPIDGHPGMLGVCRLSSGGLRTCASYFIGSNSSGHELRTNCRVLSTYPWDVTRDLLNSLHIEENQ